MQQQQHRTYSFWYWVLVVTATTTTTRTIPSVVAFSGSLLRFDAAVATRGLGAVTRHYRRRRATNHLSTAVGSSSARMTSCSTRECSSSRSMVPETISFTCTDGIVLTGQSYQRYSSRNGDEKNAPLSDHRRRRRRILCLHGWMDNCRSYYYFAPFLLERLVNGDEHDNEHVHLVALDFPGHGRSDHFGPGRPGMVLAELIVYVAEALRALGWTTHHGHSGDSGGGGDAATVAQPTKTITLVGHSMGAAVACLYAASFPEHIDKLVLLEGVGPLARPALDAAKHVRKHVEKRLLSPTLYAEPRRYENLELAVAARCRTARTWPGNQYLSEAAARQLVEYGTKVSTSTTGDDDDDVVGTTTTTLDADYYQFRHDPRLQWPSLQFFTQEQTDGVYKDIQCPTALILAADGWPFDESTRRRTMELLRPVHTVTLPGSHHWHMDPDTAPAVVEQTAAFLRSSAASS